jgi:glycosyltransferase involved in cell wall biosynthesis
MPDGHACGTVMSETQCAACLPDHTYRARMLALTHARAAAIQGARLVVLSQYMAQALCEAGLPGAEIIPPQVPTAPAPSDAGHGFLLAGRLVHHKGIDLAVQAWHQAQVPGPLAVAGLGPLAEHMVPAQQLGWLDRQALRQALTNARALLFPTRWQEPFGILGVEALAVGTPVIAMVSGGMGAWSDAGTICIAPGDVAGMADAIRRLHDDAEFAQSLGAAGWQMVQDRFSSADAHTRLWSIYAATA